VIKHGIRQTSSLSIKMFEFFKGCRDKLVKTPTVICMVSHLILFRYYLKRFSSDLKFMKSTRFSDIFKFLYLAALDERGPFLCV